MSDEKPTLKPPSPGIPERHRRTLHSADDFAALKESDFEEERKRMLLDNERIKAELASARAEKEEAEERADAILSALKGDKDEKPTTSVQPKSKVAFNLSIRDWAGAGKFVGAVSTAILAIVGSVLGFYNAVTKAPEANVSEIDDKAENAKKAIEGDRSAQTRRAEQGLAKRIDLLEMNDKASEELRCRRQRWLAEVLKRQPTPVFVEISGCDNTPGEEFEAREGPADPRGRKRQIIVITPMP